MPDISVEIEVFCSCGAGLCGQSTGGSGRYGPNVTVEPCEKCLKQARDEAYQEGYSDAENICT